MKVFLKKVIADLAGEPMNDVEDPKKSLTIKNAMLFGLVNADPREQVDAEEKYRMFKLSQKIYRAEDSVNLKDKDVTLIKKCVGKIFSPVAVGRVYDILDGEDVDTDDDTKVDESKD